MIGATSLETSTFLGLGPTAWGAIGAIATVVAVVIALVAAIVALRQLRHSRELSEEQARPYVVASTVLSEADRNHVDLVLQNIGHTAASNVRVTIDPPYVRAIDFGGEPFMDAYVFKSSIPTMPPGFKLNLYLDSAAKHHQQPHHPAKYAVSVAYEDRQGKVLQDVYEIDLDIYVGILTLQVHGLHHIASSLRALAKERGINSY